MDISLVLNDSGFWVALGTFIFLVWLTFSIITKTPPEAYTKQEEQEVIRIGLAIIVVGWALFWYFRGDSILWAIQPHGNLLTVQGYITESTIDYKPGARSGGWHYQIRYSYEVNDKVYESERVNYGYTGSSDISFSTEYIEKYPVGKQVTVFYDPQDPMKSVLEPEVKEYGGIYTLIMIVSWGCFFLFVGSVPKRYKPRPKNVIFEVFKDEG